MKVELGDIFIAFEMDIVFMENMTKSDLEMNDSIKREIGCKRNIWLQSSIYGHRECASKTSTISL